MHHILRVNIICFSLFVSLFAETIYFSPDGEDHFPGTKEEPLKRLSQLKRILQERPEITEVVFAAGHYSGAASVKPSENKSKQLLIRAEEGAKVIFDGGKVISKAKGDVNIPGYYIVPGEYKMKQPPRPWEEDTRIRYQEVEDIRTVKAVPGTYCFDKKNLYFHTSDSQPLEKHRVGMGKYRNGLFIKRENVKVQGIHFQNYLVQYWSSGIDLRLSSSIVENCSFWNCRIGIGVSSTAHDCRIINVKINDCGSGVYSTGNRTITQICMINKINDRFVIQCFDQDNAGIQYYYPAKDGEASYNIIKGFAKGIFFKGKGDYLAKHNTVVDCKSGIWRTNPDATGDKFIANIIFGCDNPFPGSRQMKLGTINDYNCIWDVKNPQNLADVLNELPLGGSGKNNFVSDPQFVDVKNGDYRLLPNSPCISLSPNSKTIGALPVVKKGFKDSVAPTCKIRLLHPAKPAGDIGQLDFERDPWIGGGKTLIRSLKKEGSQIDFVTKEKKLTLFVAGLDEAGPCVKLKWSVNHNTWQEGGYESRKKVTLKEMDGVQSIRAQVCDSSGNWSEIKEILVRFEKSDLQLKGKPTIYSNDHGVVVSFETKTPVFAEIHYGESKELGSVKKEAQPIERKWISNDGGDWVKRWKKARERHHIPLIFPEVEQGKKYYYKLKLSNVLGENILTDFYQFKVSGEPKTWYVSNGGLDQVGRGQKNTPYQNIQYAVDRALPGDTVLISSGLYTQSVRIRHGGVENARIMVKALDRGKVILDGVRRVDNLLYLENAPFVTLSGMNIRSFDLSGAGIYIVDSDNVTVEYCRVRNSFMEDSWPVGNGIFAHRSKDLSFSHNLVLRNAWGITLLESPGSKVLNNTAYKNLYYGVGLFYSSQNAEIYSNSLCFNGNDQLSLHGTDWKAFKSIKCDYNNYATHLYFGFDKDGVKIQERNPDEKTGSKAIIFCYLPGNKKNRFREMEDWVNEYGLDKNSMFLNPQYVGYEPYDFRLLPRSPNIGKGKDGSNIGAFGVKETN